MTPVAHSDRRGRRPPRGELRAPVDPLDDGESSRRRGLEQNRPYPAGGVASRWLQMADQDVFVNAGRRREVTENQRRLMLLLAMV